MNTRVLLAIAAILITNSHLEGFYPTPLLAGDGLLGNSIFFMVAGLGVTLSAQKRLRPFPHFYWRRIKRIYPTVFLVVTTFVLLAQRTWGTWNWREYAAHYLWPTPWAFVAQVMVLYVPFYLLLLTGSRRAFTIAFAGLYVVFGLCWLLYPQATARLSLGTLHPSIYWVFWFQMMVLGGLLASRSERLPSSPLALSALLVAAAAAYVAAKVIFVTGRVAQFHFVLFPIVQLIICLLVLLARTTPPQALRGIGETLRAPAQWIGSRTLEIYTLQTFLVGRGELAHRLPFPLNIIAFWAVLLMLAWVVGRAVAFIVPERSHRPAVA